MTSNDRLWAVWYSGGKRGAGPENYILLATSGDGGATWGKPFMALDRSDQIRLFDPEIWRSPDGRLWLISRIDDGIGEAFSEDGGKTWTEMTKTPYKQSSSRTQTRRLASGNILFLKNGPIEGVDGKDVGRSRMMAFLSEDGGKTWIGGLTLDPRNNVSHPDFSQAPDGSICMVWDRDRGRAGEILFARFTEDDVRAGRYVSEKAVPATVVNRLEKE